MNPVDRAEVDRRRAGTVGAGVPLGRWAGIPIAAHWSAAATLALFAWLLAGSVLPSTAPGHVRGTYWALGVLTATVFLATILAHELAHAVTARHYGVRIARITLWMLGGLTELDGDPPSPRAEAWIAASGPLVSIGTGLGCGALAWATGFDGLTGAALVWLAEISVLIGLFNLLPGAPLDGGRLLRAILWHRYRDRDRANTASARAGRVLGVVLITLGLVEVAFGGLGGLWFALIGWFILTASNAERCAVDVNRLSGTTVTEIMSPNPVTAADWWTVDHLLDELRGQRPQDTIPLVDFSGHLSGVISLRQLSLVPARNRDTTRLREVSHAASSLTLGASVPDGLPAVQRGATVVVVDDAGRPVGLISPAELNRALLLAALRERTVTPAG